MNTNDLSSMSKEMDAKKAMDLAKGFLDDAKYGYYFIEGVKHEGSNWTVRAKTLANKLVVTINDRGDFLGLDVIDG